MVLVDSDGRIVLVNREIERLFGYSRDELLGLSIDVLVPERFRGRHPSFRGHFYEAPEVRAMGAGRELFGLRKDGAEIPVEIGLNPIETDEGLFVLSSIVDVSARRAADEQRLRLEEQLRQSQKMEALGRLAGGIAHDFNNVLGGIVGYTELAQASARDPQLLADLDEVLRAAQRGKTLVERILRFSRQQELAPRPLDLTTAVSDAARLLRATLPAGIDIRLHCEAEVPRVMADATSVEQVVMNLATNAAHAMSGSGTLGISVEPRYVRDSFARAHPGLREGLFVQLAVSDTGHGMDEATRARAFEPFFTTKPSGAGSGLGLSMVHGVVSAHGGAVWLESELGRGTTVSCLFRAAESDVAEAVVTDPAAPRGHGERVLYVDDEPTLTRIGKRVLGGLGYRAQVETDPARVLALLRADPSCLDAVITDFSMPGMNGVELARALTALRPDLPILLLSGYVEEFPLADLTAAGIRLVVKKPVTVRELAVALRQALGRD
jgi:two-component system, cell cycle sensor histidine kinase and response regulator CckA